MTKVLKGLKDIKANQERVKAENEAREAARNRVKADWLSEVFPGGKDKLYPDEVVVQFLQELDEDATGYDPDRGLAIIVTEHEPPGKDGYKRPFKCSHEEDDDSCFGCEQRAATLPNADPNDRWKNKQNLYVNVAVEVDGKPKTFVLKRNANSGFGQSLIQDAIDENTITDVKYRITRVGEGTQTNWLIKRLKDSFDLTGLEVFDLEEVAVRDVPYERQKEYVSAVYKGPSKPAAAVETDEDEW